MQSQSFAEGEEALTSTQGAAAAAAAAAGDVVGKKTSSVHYVLRSIFRQLEHRQLMDWYLSSYMDTHIHANIYIYGYSVYIFYSRCYFRLLCLVFLFPLHVTCTQVFALYISTFSISHIIFHLILTLLKHPQCSAGRFASCNRDFPFRKPSQ